MPDVSIEIITKRGHFLVISIKLLIILRTEMCLVHSGEHPPAVKEEVGLPARPVTPGKAKLIYVVVLNLLLLNIF